MVRELALGMRTVPLKLVEVERLDRAVREVLRETDSVICDVRLFADDGDLPLVSASLQVVLQKLFDKSNADHAEANNAGLLSCL